jgi:hypothetical protein
MSPDEKLIAQWEAQHDVAARGHRGDPLGLQRSLSRERLADRMQPPRGATGSRQMAARGQPAVPETPAPEVPAADAAAQGSPVPGRRHPWRRFHRHASEH